MKIIFYIPLILFLLLYGYVAASIGISSISPILLVWFAFYLAAGILLSKGKIVGALLGMMPGIHLIYMSTINTGQVINIERPMGIFIVIFYLICSGLVILKKRMTKNIQSDNVNQDLAE